MKKEASQFLKKSVTLHGHKTSISLEKAFWTILEVTAEREKVSLTQLIQSIDENREGNLASSLRLYALEKVIMSPDLFKPSFEHPVRCREGKDSD